MINGISHITFIVRDLEKSMAFFRDALDAVEVYSSGDKTFSLTKEKFFTVNGMWFAIMEGVPLERSYHHIAFDVSDDDFEKYEIKLKALNVEMREPRTRKNDEGRSLYFYDLDNNMFEIHSGTLEKRLSFYKDK